MNRFGLILSSYLVLVPSAVLCYLPMKNNLRLPFWKLLALCFGAIALLAFSGAFLEYKFGGSSNLVFLSVVMLAFAGYHKTLNVHIAKSAAIFMWNWAILATLSNFATMIDAVIHPQSVSAALTLTFVISQSALVTLFLLLSLPLALKYAVKLIDELEITKVWTATIPVTMVYVMLNIAIRPIYYETLYTNNVFRAFISVVSALFVTQIFLTILFYFIVDGMSSYARTIERNRILEMQESQYLTQQRYIEATAKERHDFRHTVRTLDELLRSGDVPTAVKFLDDYIHTMPKNDITRYCTNNAVNAVLNYYKNAAEDSGVKCSFEIVLPEDMPVGTVELCSMFGNILENAVIACTEVPEIKRQLYFTAVMHESYNLYIIAQNSYGKKLRKRKGRYISTHMHGSGVGLRSISQTVQNYGGFVDYSNDDEYFYTKIKIPLNNKKTEA